MRRRRFVATLIAMLVLPSSGAGTTDPDFEAVAGAVYTMTNAPDGNEVLVFARGPGGELWFSHAVPTGGRESGGGLNPLLSQSSLVLSHDRRFLFAVNAGSNDVTVFAVHRDELVAMDIIESGGIFPVSIAVAHDLAYVLNNGGIPNIAGFTFRGDGTLAPLADARRTLGEGGYSQIGFDPKARFLVVSARTANALLVFPVDAAGLSSDRPIVTLSLGAGPFGFFFHHDGHHVLVGESIGGAVSAYRDQPDGTLLPVSRSVGSGPICWIAILRNGFVYTANTGTGTLSLFSVQPGRGSLTLLDAAAAKALGPLDLGVSQNDRFLYALDPLSAAIAAYAAGPDGNLRPIGAFRGPIPVFAQGLAAW